MRSMSQSLGKPPRIVSKLVEKWRAVCLLSPLAAVIYMSLIILPEYNEPTRISENALLPALVTEQFSYSNRIAAFAKALRTEKNRVTYVASQLKEHGITSQLQTYHFPVTGSNKTRTNVYALIHASRSSSVESILVAVAIDETVEATALTLALATYCREQTYWARNLIFVFVDGGPLGMESFLAAYHGRVHSYLRYDRIRNQGGSIIGAFAIRTTGSNFNDLNMEYNMMNGQLPNLDLINLFVRLADKFGLTPTIYDIGHQSSWENIAETVMKGMLTQAFTSVQGLHSVFGSYGIQAVTAHAKGSSGHVSLSKFARICEGALRSLNNILERFHQSYFLYILSNARRFISVAYYMPVIGMMVLPLIILALREWFALSAFSLSNSYFIFHMIGLTSYFAGNLAANYHSKNGFYVHIMLLLFPYYWLVPGSHETVGSTKFFFFLELALAIASISLLNFSFAFFLSVFAVPIAILFSAVDIKKRNWIKGIFGFTVHPLMLFILLRVMIFNPNESVSDALSILSASLSEAYLLLDNITVPFLQIFIIPLWCILLQCTSVNGMISF